MTIIFGLGNPEKDYKGTRHNVGFEVINKLAFDNNIEIKKAKHRAHFGEGFINNTKVMLVKPQTFMNLSGECVKEMISYYKVGKENIIVVYDDIDLDVGAIRIRKGGSAGTHNGMRNIVYQLGYDDFVRVRVGIGNKPEGYDLADYVLNRFSKSETDAIVSGISKAGDAVWEMLKNGVDIAMNKYN